jgi:hypothetical protein
LESVTEIDPTTCKHLVEKTDVMKWILKRIKSPPNYDQVLPSFLSFCPTFLLIFFYPLAYMLRTFQNKEYASEILAILLQNNTDNQRILGELDGIESLLVAVNVSPLLPPYLIFLSPLTQFILDSPIRKRILQELKKRR